MVIASSQANEVSLAGHPYSAFTYALIEAFSGVSSAKAEDADGRVWAMDLAMHAAERVPVISKGLQHPKLHIERADNYPVAYYAAGSLGFKGVPNEFLLPADPGSRATLDQVIDRLCEMLTELHPTSGQARVDAKELGPARNVSIHG